MIRSNHVIKNTSVIRTLFGTPKTPEAQAESLQELKDENKTMKDTFLNRYEVQNPSGEISNTNTLRL